MRDVIQDLSTLDQRASGSITYGVPVGGVKATGTVTVVDYLKAILTAAAGTITYGSPTAGVKASGTITVADYSLMSAVQSSMTITITDYADLGEETVTVDGNALVEGSDWTAATSNDATATSLAAAIDGLANFEASAVGAVVTVKYATAGTAGDGKVVTSSDVVHLTLSAGVTSGGRNATVVTVNGTALTANVDFNAVTSNNQTATNLAAAIDALSNVGAAAVGAVVTVTADNEGTAGNAYTIASSYASAATVSGATLAGGINGDTVTVAGTTFTCVTSSPGATEFTNIAELTALIDALATVTATDNGTVITVTAASAGAAGNSIAMTKTGSALTLSGATLAGGYDNLTINFNGTALVQGSDFTAATSNAATATSIASAIDGISGVGAAAVGAVVTVTNDAIGTAGNAKTMTTSSTAAATVSGATLSGGVAGDTVVVDGNTFTCVVASPAANQFSNVNELEALVEAVTGIDSTVASGVISIKATTPGAAGNSITLALGGSNAGTMTISGATLTGGSDFGYSSSVHMQGHSICDIFVDVTALAGSTPTLDITPQISPDNVHWHDAKDTAGNAITFTQITGASQQFKRLPIVSSFVRVKLDLGGTNPIPTGQVAFIASGQ